MLIGERIKKIRKEKGLSQQEVGDMLNVTKVSICGYENGTRTPSLETLILLADSFEVSIDYLVGREIEVSVEEKEETKRVSSTDIEIVECLKKYPELYNKLIKDPNRYIALLNKKLK